MADTPFIHVIALRLQNLFGQLFRSTFFIMHFLTFSISFLLLLSCVSCSTPIIAARDTQCVQSNITHLRYMVTHPRYFCDFYTLAYVKTGSLLWL